MISIILLVFSFVLLVLATLGVSSHPRFNLLAGGLTFYVAYVLFSLVGKL